MKPRSYISKKRSVSMAAKSLALVGLVFLVAACTESVYSHKPTKIGMSKDIELSKVTDAIQAAGKATKWRTTVIRPGLIEATREWGGGKHKIVVDVVYSAKVYEIKYKASKNLKYTGRSIHRSYAEQVGLLDNAIKARTWNM